jgi:biopolymer transport protein ExbB
MEAIYTFIGQSDWVVKIFIAFSIVLLTLVGDRLYELLRTQRELRGLEEDPHTPLRKRSPLHALLGEKCRDEREIDLKLNRFEQQLRRYSTVLGLIAVLAPMLGLVGTFLGVFQVFEGVSDVGLSDPKVIAGGIRKVLVDTVAGLSIAIPAMMAFKGFEVWTFALSLRGEALLLVRRKDSDGTA